VIVFIGAALDTTGGAGATSSLGVAITNSLDFSVAAVNVMQLTDIQTLVAANFAGTASATKIKVGATKFFVVADVAGDADEIQNLYYVDGTTSITLVGTLNEGALVDANFVTA